MIIDPEQLTPSGSQGERSPLKTSPPLPARSSSSDYDLDPQPPPAYVPPSGSGSYNAIVHPYTAHPMNPNINFNTSPNPNPKPFKRFFKAFLVAILCLILWGIFVDTVGLMVKVEVGTHDDKRMQGLTPVERYMSMGPGGGIRRLYFSLINDSWAPSPPPSLPSDPSSTPLALNRSSAPLIAYPRPFPIQYPPSFSWVSPPMNGPSETPSP